METGNKIANEGVKALSEMLKVNTTLTNLFLHGEKNTKNSMKNEDESLS